MAAQRYTWTPDRDALLREQYDSRVRGKTGVIAKRLGWPVHVIKKRAAILGLTAPQPSSLSNPPWTEAEDAIVQDLVGQRSAETICKRLKRHGFLRSVTAVIVRIKKLHLSRRISSGYTMRDLELALGIDHRRIERLVRDGKLRGTAVGDTRSGLPGHAWHFTDEAVIAFLRDHRTAYRLDRVDQTWFLGLVFDATCGGKSRRLTVA